MLYAMVIMHYIVGLGNPGDKYEHTRHNVGFLIIKYFVQKAQLPAFVDSSKYYGKVTEGILNGTEVTVFMPHTYMNQSGSAVTKLLKKQESKNLIVVYDDIDLSVGELKVSYGKGSGGHKGIESIITAIETKDFTRIRVGIAGKSFWTGKIKRPKGGMGMTKRVLGKFTTSEMKILEEVKERTYGALHTILSDGIEKAMNQMNKGL